MRYSTVYLVAKVVCFVSELVWERRFSYLQTYGQLLFVFLSCLIIDNSLIGFVFCPSRYFFTNMETSPLLVKGCVTCARHLMPLSIEGSLVCHTYCYTRHPFKIVIFEDPWNWHPLPSIRQWSSHYLLLRIGSVILLYMQIRHTRLFIRTTF